MVRGERSRQRGHRPHARDGGGADHPGHAGRHAQGASSRSRASRAARSASGSSSCAARSRTRRVVYVDGVPIPQLFHFGGHHLGRERRRRRGDRLLPGELREPVRARARRDGGAPHARAAARVARRGADGRVRRSRRGGGAGRRRAPRTPSVRRSWIDAVLAVGAPAHRPRTRRTTSASRRATTTGRRSSPYPRPRRAGAPSSPTARTTSSSSCARRTGPGARRFYLSTVFWRVGASHRAPVGRATNDLVVAAGRDSFDVLSGGDVRAAAPRSSRSRSATRSPAALADASRSRRAWTASLRRIDTRCTRRRWSRPGAVGDPFAAQPTTVGESGERAGGSRPRPGSRPTGARCRGCGSSAGCAADVESRFGRDEALGRSRASRPSWTPAPGTTVVAAAGLFGSAPEPQETSKTFGNPDLDPERGLHLSLGVRQDLPWCDAARADRLLQGALVARRADPRRRPGRTAPPAARTRGAARRSGSSCSSGASWRAASSAGSPGPGRARSGGTTRPTRTTRAGDLFPLDQTHVVALVLSYRLPREWIVGHADPRGDAGTPTRRAVGAILDADTGRYQCLPRRAALAPAPRLLPGGRARSTSGSCSSAGCSPSTSTSRTSRTARTPSSGFRNFDCSQTSPRPLHPDLPRARPAGRVVTAVTRLLPRRRPRRSARGCNTGFEPQYRVTDLRVLAIRSQVQRRAPLADAAPRRHPRPRRARREPARARRADASRGSRACPPRDESPAALRRPGVPRGSRARLAARRAPSTGRARPRASRCTAVAVRSHPATALDDGARVRRRLTRGAARATQCRLYAELVVVAVAEARGTRSIALKRVRITPRAGRSRRSRARRTRTTRTPTRRSRTSSARPATAPPATGGAVARRRALPRRARPSSAASREPGSVEKFTVCGPDGARTSTPEERSRLAVVRDRGRVPRVRRRRRERDGQRTWTSSARRAPFTLWVILRDGRGGERLGDVRRLDRRVAQRQLPARGTALPAPAPRSVFRSSSVKKRPPPKKTSLPIVNFGPPG